MDEVKLIEKLRRIEALFSGATTDGEQVAAERARERILERLKLAEKQDPPVEFRFSMPDMWSRKVFVTLLRRYGIAPYRYKGQRYTTVMAKVCKKFVDETLWPEYDRISNTLHSYLTEVTDRVVSKVIHQDASEVVVVDTPHRLNGNVTDNNEPIAPRDSSSPSRVSEEVSHQKTHPDQASSSNSRNKKKRTKKKRR